MKRYGVRPSVCSSCVPAWAHSSKHAAAGLLLWARLAGDIDRLLKQRRANAGSATLSAYVSSWTQTFLGVFSVPFARRDAELSRVSNRRTHYAIPRDKTPPAAAAAADGSSLCRHPVTASSRFHTLTASSSSSSSSTTSTLAKKSVTTDSSYKKRSRAAFSRAQVGVANYSLAV